MSESTGVAYPDVPPDDVPPDDVPPHDDTGRDDDLATLLAKREHARPNRATWVLLTLVVLLAGFMLGAGAYMKFGPTTGSAATFPGGFARPGGLPAGGLPEGGLPAGGLPAGGFPAEGSAGLASGGAGPGLAGGSPATFGTVQLVDGNHLYVVTPDGRTVKVKVPGTAPVTAQKQLPLSELAAGSTVVVRGDTAADGTVTATSVSQGSFARAGQPDGSANVPAGGSAPQAPPSTSQGAQ
jgi:hypothetical protein